MTKDVKVTGSLGGSPEFGKVEQSVPQVNLGMASDPRASVENRVVAPNSPVAAVSQEVASKPRAQGIERGRGYVKRNQGYPVKPGETWHDLSHQERVNWMTGKENQWKRNFGMQGAGQALQANLDWTRG